MQVLVDPDGAWQDPAQVCDLTLDAQPGAAARGARRDRARSSPTPAWTAAWADADARAARGITELLGDELSEPRVALELGAGLPPDATLVVASSMPVRDVETVLPARATPLRVLSNRGANGIDGTLATAYGVAAASPGPVVLLTGDVALAHDAGSLLTARRIGVPLTIVLIDNGGGGIFDFLPVASQADHFETHVATPHDLDVAGLAQAYGLHLLPVEDLAGLRASIEFGLASDGTQLIHVRTDRAENVLLHRTHVGDGRRRARGAVVSTRRPARSRRLGRARPTRSSRTAWSCGAPSRTTSTSSPRCSATRASAAGWAASPTAPAPPRCSAAGSPIGTRTASACGPPATARAARWSGAAG